MVGMLRSVIDRDQLWRQPSEEGGSEAGNREQFRQSDSPMQTPWEAKQLAAQELNQSQTDQCRETLVIPCRFLSSAALGLLGAPPLAGATLRPRLKPEVLAIDKCSSSR